MQGYTVSLRNSSIRPDLEVLLKELLELGVKQFDRFFFTTDGSHMDLVMHFKIQVKYLPPVKSLLEALTLFRLFEEHQRYS